MEGGGDSTVNQMRIQKSILDGPAVLAGDLRPYSSLNRPKGGGL